MPQDVLENPHNYCCYALANQIKGNYIPIPDKVTIINNELIIPIIHRFKQMKEDFGLKFLFNDDIEDELAIRIMKYIDILIKAYEGWNWLTK